MMQKEVFVIVPFEVKDHQMFGGKHKRSESWGLIHVGYWRYIS